MTFLAVLAVFAQVSASQPVNVARVAEDAKVIDRVAELSRRDLPRDLLRRMVNDDIDALRGRRGDGTYQWAAYERMEAGRIEDSFSVQPARDDRLARIEMKGSFVYRLVMEIPSRRLVVTRNRRLWIDRIEIEYIPERGTTSKLQNIKVEAWLEPGASRQFDFEDVAKQATVRLFARADQDAGYGNIALALVQARIFDDPNSPYAAAVANAKAILKALENDDVKSIRNLAARMHDALRPHVQPTPAGRELEVTAAPMPMPMPAREAVAAPPENVYGELQTIQDLLTGTEAEKREGMDRLHQLIRRLRPR